MIRYHRRYVEPDDVCLFEHVALRTEIVVERLCACPRCKGSWWAEAGKPTEHRCPHLNGALERFEVPA